jgi:hypothetical protein
LPDSIINEDVLGVYKTSKGQPFILFSGDMFLGLISNDSISFSSIGHYFYRCVLHSSNDNWWFGRMWDCPVYLDSDLNLEDHVKIGLVGELQSTMAITEDTDSNIWLATWGGIVKIDSKSLKNKVFKQRDGTLSDIVNYIVTDQSGMVWASMQGGITRIDPNTEHIVNFDKYDGLNFNNFSEGVGCITSNGDIYFGIDNDLLVFNPENIESNQEPPRVVITNFSIFNESVYNEYGTFDKSILKENISSLDIIELTYQQNTFEFEFSALDYVSPKEPCLLSSYIQKL